MHENRVFIEKALSYGVQGYILKDSAADEVVRAIREVHAGRYFLSSKISSYVVQDYLARKKQPVKVKSAATLTPREREILQLIAEGLNSKEIAEKLSVHLRPYWYTGTNIMQKLDMHNQAQLIRFALKEGISQPLVNRKIHIKVAINLPRLNLLTLE
jgi:DNA-binding NarL/FixJ family response regulator